MELLRASQGARCYRSQIDFMTSLLDRASINRRTRILLNYCSPHSENERSSARAFYVRYFLVFLIVFLIRATNPLAAEEDALHSLSAALQSSDVEERFNAVYALGASGDPRATPILIEALEKDMRERTGILMAIIPALGQLGSPRAIPELIAALNNREDDWLAREIAARALGQIGSPKAVPDLIHAAWIADTREPAIIALASIADIRAIDVLVTAFDSSEDEAVRNYAFEGIVTIGLPAVPALISILEKKSTEYDDPTERMFAARALGEIGDARAQESLQRALEDVDPQVRRNAAEALTRLHSKNL